MVWEQAGWHAAKKPTQQQYDGCVEPNGRSTAWTIQLYLNGFIFDSECFWTKRCASASHTSCRSPVTQQHYLFLSDKLFCVFFFFHRCFSLFSALSASVNITNNANELVLLCNLKCISCAKGPPKKIATSQTQGIMADKD